MKIRTNLKARDYHVGEICRIINPKQQKLYIKNHLYPIDIYTSIDFDTGEDMLVMIFLKEETKEAYKAWKNYELE